MEASKYLSINQKGELIFQTSVTKIEKQVIGLFDVKQMEGLEDNCFYLLFPNV